MEKQAWSQMWGHECIGRALKPKAERFVLIVCRAVEQRHADTGANLQELS